MAYETGIEPRALMDTPAEVFDAMVDHRKALIAQAKKNRRG